MSSGLSFNATNFYKPLSFSTKPNNTNAQNQYSAANSLDSLVGQADGEQLLMNSLYAIANQNGYNTNPINSTGANQAQNTEQVAEMLEAGNKQQVKDEMGAQAVPALLAIVKDTSQPEQVRIDAIATLAKLVDEGKAPASCLVQLLKDPNCKDMAERAMANVGKEIMPVVKQLLNSGDPQMQESAKNILHDMQDAWAGYENDPKWGQECQELLPEVEKLLAQVDKKENNGKTQTTQNQTAQNYYQDADDPNNPANLAGYNRQHINFSNLMA